MVKILKKTRITQSKQVMVDHSLCLFCGACVGACPANAIFLWNSYLEINESVCTLCGICIEICPVDALSVPEKRQEVIR